MPIHGPFINADLIALEKSTSEGVSTTLLTGGVISINADPTKIDISAGTGRIVDASDPANITSKVVTWTDKIGVTITNIAIQPATFLAIDENGDVDQSGLFPSGTVLRSCIQLGSAGHLDLATITQVTNFTSARGFQVTVTLTELQSALGVINKQGNVFSGDPAGNLKIKKTAGDSFFMGLQRDPLNPNIISTIESVAPVMVQSWRDGVGGYVFGTSDAVTAGVYDDDTGGVLSPSGVLTTNQWTNHLIFHSPDINLFGIVYGQFKYNSETLAQGAIDKEIFDISPVLAGIPIRAALTMRGGATNLTLVADALFRQANKFGDF